jgi:predicted Fe-S protein YdhL (DUF1289 family)
VLSLYYLKIYAVDDKERKRERDRARWHAMSQEKKNAIYKRRRESYHQRKKQHVTESTDCNEHI